MCRNGWAVLGLHGLLVALMTGCGGGGDGGGGGATPAGGGGVPAPQVLAGTSVRLDSPQQGISATVAERSQMPDTRLVGTASGDLSALSGRTVFVIIEDPDQLFDPTPVVTTQGVSTIAVDLRGRALTALGTRRGVLTVHVCLDAQCSTRLANSPLLVPYEVVVEKGLTLSSTTLEVRRTFGDPAFEQTVTVGLLSQATSFTVVPPPFDPLAPTHLSLGPATFSGNTGSFRLSVRPALPGNYTETIRIRATGPGGSNTPPPEYEETLTIHYTVADKPSIDVVFLPEEIDATRIQGDTLFKEEAFAVLVKPGATLTWEATEYDDNPATANGHPNVSNWFLIFPTVGTSSCFNTGTTSDCLPPGEYSARLRYRVEKNGSSSTIRVPVRMTIVP